MLDNVLRRKVEKAIVRNLVGECIAAGFVPMEVDDGGDENVPTIDIESVIEAVFSVDESRVYFQPIGDRGHGKPKHGVFLVGGNGCDIISDWHCGNKDFNDAVQRACDKELEVK